MSLKLGITLLIMTLFGAPVGYGFYHASFETVVRMVGPSMEHPDL
jgi:hypothetical protein